MLLFNFLCASSDKIPELSTSDSELVLELKKQQKVYLQTIFFSNDHETGVKLHLKSRSPKDRLFQESLTVKFQS